MTKYVSRGKAAIYIAIPVFVFIVFNAFYSAPQLRSYIMAEKQQQITCAVEQSLAWVQRLHELEQTGLISREDAQAAALQTFRELRYGQEARDYYWVSSTDGRFLAHPHREDLEGQDLSSSSDYAEYAAITDRFVEVATQGGGIIQYKWQYYGVPGRTEEKISYVASFEAWDWIVGTGLYIPDIEEATKAQLNINTLYILAVLQLILVAYVIGVIRYKRRMRER